MGVFSGRGVDGIHGSPLHNSIHQETAEHHSGEGGLPAHILTVHGGREHSRDETDGALVVSRRSN